MNHFIAVKAVFDFAHCANALALGQLLLVAGIKMNKTQVQHAAGSIFHLHNQLLARLELHFLMLHHAFHLARHADGRIGNRRDVGFVFITQRQVQRQFPRRVEVQLFKLFGRGVGDFQQLLMVGYHVEKRLIVSSGHFKRFRPQMGFPAHAFRKHTKAV